MFYVTRIIGVGFMYLPTNLELAYTFVPAIFLQMIGALYSCYLLIEMRK